MEQASRPRRWERGSASRPAALQVLIALSLARRIRRPTGTRTRICVASDWIPYRFGRNSADGAANLRGPYPLRSLRRVKSRSDSRVSHPLQRTQRMGHPEIGGASLAL
jgi:hypothetical protein